MCREAGLRQNRQDIKGVDVLKYLFHFLTGLNSKWAYVWPLKRERCSADVQLRDRACDPNCPSRSSCLSPDCISTINYLPLIPMLPRNLLDRSWTISCRSLRMPGGVDEASGADRPYSI